MCHLLGIVTAVGKQNFQKFMLSLTTDSPITLLASGTDIRPPLLPSPLDVFLSHLRHITLQRIRDQEDAKLINKSLDNLQLPLVRAFSGLQPLRQQWLLFFALPAACARQSKTLEADKAAPVSLPTLQRNSEQEAQLSVKAQAGLLCFKLTLSFDVPATDEG